MDPLSEVIGPVRKRTTPRYPDVRPIRNRPVSRLQTREQTRGRASAPLRGRDQHIRCDPPQARVLHLPVRALGQINPELSHFSLHGLSLPARRLLKALNNIPVPEKPAEFVAIAAALRGLPTEFVLDGEAVAHCSEGLPDFHGLLGRDGQRTASTPSTSYTCA